MEVVFFLNHFFKNYYFGHSASRLRMTTSRNDLCVDRYKKKRGGCKPAYRFHNPVTGCMTVHFYSNAHHMPARSLLLICLALPVRASGHPLLSDDRLVFSLQTIERHGHKYHFSAEGSNSDPLYTCTDNRMWNDNMIEIVLPLWFSFFFFLLLPHTVSLLLTTHTSL